jgi:HK97 family phage portal protein
LTLSTIGSWPWWPTRILESYAGAWQQNVVVDRSTVSSYWAVFACTTLIAGDTSKLPLRVVQVLDSGIKKPTKQRPVLRAPNHFQTPIEFIFSWVMSELLFGNTYVLKRRDSRGFVDALYVLSPQLVEPLVADDGSIYYRLHSDNLANIETSVVVPASEIIHDRMYTIHHPLAGVSPIYACGIAAMQGAAIQDNSAKFFENMSRPSGMLTAPGPITNDTAGRLKEAWETNFSGANIGRIAVLGDGLKYEAMSVNAHDAQLIEQLKMTGEMIAACFKVPGYKIGVGPMPTVNNLAALNQQYYDQCLQRILENIESLLDIGLELDQGFEVEFDLSGLLRMDPASRYAAHQQAIAGSWKTPNEVRIDENLSPVKGGDTVYMQSQNQSLEALAFRDKEATDGKADVQASAMNGAQVQSLTQILEQLSLKKIPPDAAKAAIRAAFPLLTQEQVNALVDPFASFVPPPTEGTAPVVPDDEPEEDESDDEAKDVTESLIRELFSKSPEAVMYA